MISYSYPQLTNLTRDWGSLLRVGFVFLESQILKFGICGAKGINDAKTSLYKYELQSIKFGKSIKNS